MDLQRDYDFSVLVNEAERMVLDELGRELDGAEERGICVCQDCVLDMAAYALNMLKPLYRVSLLGTMYAHAADGTAFSDQVKAAVRAAVKKISSNPGHD